MVIHFDSIDASWMLQAPWRPTATDLVFRIVCILMSSWFDLVLTELLHLIYCLNFFCVLELCQPRTLIKCLYKECCDIPFTPYRFSSAFYASFSVSEVQGLSTFLGLSSLLRLFCDQTSGIVSLKSNLCKTYGLYWVHGLGILSLYLTEVVFVYLFIDFLFSGKSPSGLFWFLP